MIKIGITGQKGFVGSHLYQTLGLFPEEFQRIEFDRKFFKDESLLDNFVKNCDVIVHFAALNRHNDPTIVYEMNVGLVDTLIASLERTEVKPHLIISSSTQEERDNLYGKSKKEGRLKLSKWATINEGIFSGMVIPNVYGPFGRPFYNSVIATFCYQISRNQFPNIDVDGQLKLIYVGELVDHILDAIRNQNNSHELIIPHTAEAKVSEILVILNEYKELYQERGDIPKLGNSFEHNLFNTYRCYMDIANYFPRKFVQHTDNRGAFVEIARLGIPGQTSYSTTIPGITRGNHFHTRKIERFAVIKGKAEIQLRKVGTYETHIFYLDGNAPSYVDIPIWYAHNIRNIGEETLYTIFWINEPYDEKDPDTWLEVV